MPHKPASRPSFETLLRELAEEHSDQLAKVSDENEDLRKQIEVLKAENHELHEAIGTSQEPYSAGFGTTASRATASIMHTVFRRTSQSSDGVQRRRPRSWVKWLRAIMSHPKFEFAVACLVTASAIVSSLELQHRGMNLGYRIQYPAVEAPSDWGEAAKIFAKLDLAFTVIFTAELAIRIAVFKCEFFLSFLNWLDVAAVSVSLVTVFFEDSGAKGAGVLRLLRIAKLTRGLRLMKMARVLESLHFLLQCMKASVATLFWSLCVLMIIQCIAGMLLSQLVQDFIDLRVADSADPSGFHQVYSYYGTFSRTVITMFEVHLANWSPACRVLVNYIGEWSGGLFIAYRCLAGFAVLNVINAVFIQQTLKVAQQDQDIMIMQKQRAQEMNKKNIEELFRELDKSGDGFLSKEEMDVLMNNSRLKTWLACLDIDMNDVESLLNILQVEGNAIDSTEFVRTLTDIKGPAKSIHMAQLLARTSRIEAKMHLFPAVRSHSYFQQSEQPCSEVMNEPGGRVTRREHL